MMNHSKKTSRGNKSRTAGARKAPGPGDVIVKRMTYPGPRISSTAGNVIAVDASTTAAAVQSLAATEWSSFAARYQQYRVRAVILHLEPCQTVTTTAVVHGAVYLADFIGASSPGSAAQVLSDERGLIVSTSRPIRFRADWSRNPNAKLWNPTSSALPVANSYGVCFASNANSALTASTPYFSVTIEWEVEFRGSQ
jgi:hypothetical protein